MPERLTFSGVVSDIINADNESRHWIDVGFVKEFDRSNFTAKISRVYKIPRENQDLESDDPVVVSNVKVIFPGIRWDLQPGEAGILLSGDWNFEKWYRTEDLEEPEITERNSVNNSIFLAGIHPSTSTPSLPVGSMVIESDDLRLGDHFASDHPYLGESMNTDLKTYLNAQVVWVNAVAAAVPALAGAAGTFVTAINLLSAQLAGNLATKVTVK